MYGITNIHSYDGTSTRVERTDTLGSSSVVGGWEIKTATQLTGKAAYENTVLDLYWKGQNDDGVWVALESKAPELKKFTAATDIVDDFTGVQGPERPTGPITPTDEWFTSKLQGGAVVPGTVFEIATVSDLLALPKLVNEQLYTFEGCTVKLTSEVYDLNPGWEAGQPLPLGGNIWTAVGVNHAVSKFAGTFTGEYETGKSATIKGLYVNHSAQNGGFFGELFGNVYNLKFENASLYASDVMLGTVCGRLSFGEIKNVYVADTVFIEGANGVAGGIVGRTSVDGSHRAGTISNCWFDGTITGLNKLGGIVGQVWYGTPNQILMDNCLFTGVIKTTGKEVGGLIGHCWDPSIVKNCVSNGLLCSDATASFGPVVGFAQSSTTGENTYALNKVYKYDGVTENTISTTSAYVAKTEAQLKACEGLTLDFWSASNANGVWAATANGPELKMFSTTAVASNAPQQTFLAKIKTFLTSIF